MPGGLLRQADTGALCHRVYPSPVCASDAPMCASHFFRTANTPGATLLLPSACPGEPRVMHVPGTLLLPASYPGVLSRRPEYRRRRTRAPVATAPRRGGLPPAARAAAESAAPSRAIPASPGSRGPGPACRRITGAQSNGGVMGRGLFICKALALICRPWRRVLIPADAAGEGPAARRRDPSRAVILSGFRFSVPARDVAACPPPAGGPGVPPRTPAPADPAHHAGPGPWAAWRPAGDDRDTGYDLSRAG